MCSRKKSPGSSLTFSYCTRKDLCGRLKPIFVLLTTESQVGLHCTNNDGLLYSGTKSKVNRHLKNFSGIIFTIIISHSDNTMTEETCRIKGDETENVLRTFFLRA